MGFQTKKNKSWAKDEIEPQHIHQTAKRLNTALFTAAVMYSPKMLVNQIHYHCYVSTRVIIVWIHNLQCNKKYFIPPINY